MIELSGVYFLYFITGTFLAIYYTSKINIGVFKEIQLSLLLIALWLPIVICLLIISRFKVETNDNNNEVELIIEEEIWKDD